MIADLHLVSNFGVYQGKGENIYLHNGFACALPHGTPIFAVKAGRVRRVEPHGYIVIENESAPGYAFAYANVGDIRVKEGDYVMRGQEIAHVEFSWIEHLHLDRISQVQEGNWVNPLYHHCLEHFFHWADNMDPEIDTKLYFFKNSTDEHFPTGHITVVPGEVDFVVGIRHPIFFTTRNGVKSVFLTT